MKEWTPDRFLKRGEFDLVNISLIGHDPVSGWSYEQCHQAWLAALQQASEMEKTLRWWQWRRHIRFRLLVGALAQRQGLGDVTL